MKKILALYVILQMYRKYIVFKVGKDCPHGKWVWLRCGWSLAPK